MFVDFLAYQETVNKRKTVQYIQGCNQHMKCYKYNRILIVIRREEDITVDVSSWYALIELWSCWYAYLHTCMDYIWSSGERKISPTTVDVSSWYPLMLSSFVSIEKLLRGSIPYSRTTFILASILCCLENQ